LPIFAKIQSGVLSVASQFISDGMATALATILTYGSTINKFKLTEINLDDNGLKDESFAKILKAVENQSL
jgi:hypothetical protein